MLKLTSIAILLPAVITSILCDNVSPLIPSVILLAIQWLCVWVEKKINDPQKQNPKVQRLVLWIIPFTSLFVTATFCAVIYHKTEYMMTFLCLFLGLLFVVIGNYLPKCKQSITTGIKIKWTLASEENWNATHRFCGKVWVLCGFLFMICGFLPEKFFPWVAISAIFIVVLSSVLYSYFYYKKQVRLGTAPEKVAPAINATFKYNKQFGTAGVIIGVLALIIAILALFTGTVSVTYEDSSCTINATYWKDTKIEYASIDHIEYREDFDIGMRVMGFGSPRLNLGCFRNKELGEYTVFAHGNGKNSVVLEIDGEYTVISFKDVAETKTLYDTIIDWRANYESN